MISLIIIVLAGFIGLFSGRFKENNRMSGGYYRDDYEPFDPYYNAPPRYHQEYYYDRYYTPRYGRARRSSGEGCLMLVLLIIGVIGGLIYLGGG